MKIARTLRNPLALVAQGFVLGAALFLATHPGAGAELASFAAVSTPLL